MQERRYRITNWRDYNKALIQRGSITFWFDESAIKKWIAPKDKDHFGRPLVYSDDAILAILTLRMLFYLPLRALEGFVGSIFQLMGCPFPVPSYTQICRRAQHLDVKLKSIAKKGKTDLVFDSSGFKVYGEGEWKVRMHGKSKRRTWRKLHLAIDPKTQEVVLCEMTESGAGDAQTAEKLLQDFIGNLGVVLGDGAYDSSKFRDLIHAKGGTSIIPPPSTATFKGTLSGWERERDAILATIAALGGDETARSLWKKLSGYHRRSLGETAFSRIKKFFGGSLKSRSWGAQVSELNVKCLIMNKMTNLGMPKGRWVSKTVKPI